MKVSLLSLPHNYAGVELYIAAQSTNIGEAALIISTQKKVGVITSTMPRRKSFPKCIPIDLTTLASFNNYKDFNAFKRKIMQCMSVKAAAECPNIGYGSEAIPPRNRERRTLIRSYGGELILRASNKGTYKGSYCPSVRLRFINITSARRYLGK